MAGVLSAAQPAPHLAPRLAPLREELALQPGPRGPDGAPSWTLHDPASGRFFRLGWLEFEILARWEMGVPAAIAERIALETMLAPSPEEVEDFARFLAGAQLLRASGPAALDRLARQRAAARPHWAWWLVKNYLFFRLPLLRPDRALTALLGPLGFVFTGWFLGLTLAAGGAGLFLALRQWDSFGASFLHFFSLEGAVLGLLSLVLAKALHELGHGLTAKRFGCRVPSMGIAFMLLYPMPYTDTSEAWRLCDRRQRMAVGAAGIAAELALACWALLAWSFLPEGPLRSVAFTWATTTWVLTLLVNLSPFLRFDGYYLLSDTLDVPNLQDRAFALARWRIREALFGLDEPAPEAWPPRMRRILLGWAVCTWAYRFVLFLGIALLVYHLFFKALGLLLFAIEIWWFILRPIWREAVEWTRRRHAMRLNRHTLVTGGAVTLLLLAAFLPWHGTIEAPALMAAERRTELFAQVPARVAEIAVSPGAAVEAGAPVLRLEAPDLEFRQRQVARRVETLTWQASALSQERDWVARGQILWRELQSARAELDALQADQRRLLVQAPFSGTVVELAEPLAVGEWVRAGERLAALADLGSTVIEAWVEEGVLRRVAPGQRASFVPEDPGAPRVAARILAVDGAAARLLPDAELASLHGGAIATRAGPNGAAVPELPVYRVLLAPLEPVVPRQVMRGAVLLQAEAESFAARAWRQALGVLLRESGF